MEGLREEGGVRRREAVGHRGRRGEGKELGGGRRKG